MSDGWTEVKNPSCQPILIIMVLVIHQLDGDQISSLVKKTNGVAGYNEYCPAMSDGWTEVKNPSCHVNYYYKADQWIGVETAESMLAKGEYAAGKGLAGGIVWSLDTDDFSGLCGDKYPLINALKQGLNGDVT